VAGATSAICTPASAPTLERLASISCSVGYTLPATVTVTADSATDDRTPTNDTVTVTVPGAPTNVGAVATDPPVSGSAVVSWTAPASDGGSPITGYTVAGGPAPVTTTATSVTVTDLTVDWPYTFTVTATNALGSGTGTAVSFTPQP
jgi:hypothetical protein